jgi:hypothetical protein
MRVAFIGPPAGLVTVQSVVFEPKTRTAHVAIGRIPAPSGRFFTVRLTAESTPRTPSSHP